MTAVIYLHLRPGDAPPQLRDVGPYKAVVVVEDDVTYEWQNEISLWLVRTGCLYMMAWGRECSTWDDSVDWAYLQTHGAAAQESDEGFVMTTWHENQSLSEVFWFSKNVAFDPLIELPTTYIVHIAPVERASEMIEAFSSAQAVD